MLTALLQHIPRCLFEPIAVLGVIGFVCFLYRHWKKDKAETVVFGAAFFFVTGWRVFMPIRADRYALLLIPVAIFFAVGAVREIISFIRRFIRLPDYRLFAGILLIACLVKAFHRTDDERQIFEFMNFLKTVSGQTEGPVNVVCNRDISYFLGDRFEVKNVHITGQFRLDNLPESDYYLLKLARKNLPLDLDNPDYSELKRCESPGGKSVVILWKKKKSKQQE